jgi:ribose transport system permease protein
MEQYAAVGRGRILNKYFGKQKFDNIRQLGLIVVLVILGIVFSIVNSNFLTGSNLLNVARQVSVTAVTAVGMTLVIIIGGIDLSVGSIVAFTGVVAASTLAATQSSFLSIIVALAVGAAIGFANGLITAKGKIAGFITTLATMSIFRGLGFIYTGGSPIAITDKKFISLGQGYISVVPIPIIIMLLVMILGAFVTTQTRFGRYIYALGGNEQASKWSGLNVTRITIVVYTISGFLTGLSGAILGARLASGQPFAGQGFEMDAIAAVIVGGASLNGGKGKISGTLIGVLLIGILNNGLTLMNVSTYFQMVVKGLIILLAVFIDNLSRKSA